MAEDEFGEFEAAPASCTPPSPPRWLPPSHHALGGVKALQGPLPLDLFELDQGPTVYSPSASGAPPSDPGNFSKGDLVWYSQRDGTWAAAQVASVDISVSPPSYGILVEGTCRETEWYRLHIRTLGHPPPSLRQPSGAFRGSSANGSGAPPTCAPHPPAQPQLVFPPAQPQQQPLGGYQPNGWHHPAEPVPAQPSAFPHTHPGFPPAAPPSMYPILQPLANQGARMSGTAAAAEDDDFGDFESACSPALGPTASWQQPQPQQPAAPYLQPHLHPPSPTHAAHLQPRIPQHQALGAAYGSPSPPHSGPPSPPGQHSQFSSPSSALWQRWQQSPHEQQQQHWRQFQASSSPDRLPHQQQQQQQQQVDLLFPSRPPSPATGAHLPPQQQQPFSPPGTPPRSLPSHAAAAPAGAAAGVLQHLPSSPRRSSPAMDKFHSFLRMAAPDAALRLETEDSGGDALLAPAAAAPSAVSSPLVPAGPRLGQGVDRAAPLPLDIFGEEDSALPEAPREGAGSLSDAAGVTLFASSHPSSSSAAAPAPETILAADSGEEDGDFGDFVAAADEPAALPIAAAPVAAILLATTSTEACSAAPLPTLDAPHLPSSEPAVAAAEAPGEGAEAWAGTSNLADSVQAVPGAAGAGSEEADSPSAAGGEAPVPPGSPVAAVASQDSWGVFAGFEEAPPSPAPPTAAAEDPTLEPPAATGAKAVAAVVAAGGVAGAAQSAALSAAIQQPAQGEAVTEYGVAWVKLLEAAAGQLELGQRLWRQACVGGCASALLGHPSAQRYLASLGQVYLAAVAVQVAARLLGLFGLVGELQESWERCQAAWEAPAAQGAECVQLEGAGAGADSASAQPAEGEQRALANGDACGDSDAEEPTACPAVEQPASLSVREAVLACSAWQATAVGAGAAPGSLAVPVAAREEEVGDGMGGEVEEGGVLPSPLESQLALLQRAEVEAAGLPADAFPRMLEWSEGLDGLTLLPLTLLGGIPAAPSVPVLKGRPCLVPVANLWAGCVSRTALDLD